MADDMGYRDLGCYGQTRIKTPNIDSIAKEGIQFTNACSGSAVSAPSSSSLMQGLHTGQALLRRNMFKGYRESLHKSDYTEAMMLKEAGYETGMFGKWGLGLHDQCGIKKRDGKLAVYNLIQNPEQDKDVSGSNPEITKKIEKIMHKEHVPSDVWPSPGESEETFRLRMVRLGITDKDRPINVSNF